ncbi:DUF6054 family protein [Aquibacillus kalidii]|uniref:DUF6054 family protein n=1 Tax=Aquibacillus kalidii TaxID=2762597 RepID=UPI0016466C20|nr:DUF6054 family protein [Aquibacillus kalidii]
MRKYKEFRLNIKPLEAAVKLASDEQLKAYIAHSDYKESGEDDKQISIIVLEKFFFRNGSSASLTITIDNFGGETVMKCVSTGNGEGILDIGWGAGTSFIKSASQALDEHIVAVGP